MASRSGSAGAFNWAEIHARLEKAGQAVERAGRPSGEEAERILRARARELALPRRTSTEGPGDRIELLTFCRAGERYAVEALSISEVVRIERITPVPCTPRFVAGIVLHRGELVSVIDLRWMLARNPGAGKIAPFVVAVATAEARLGFLAEAIEGVAAVAEHEITSPSLAGDGTRSPLVRGVTRELVAVLDVEAMVRDPRIIVNEDVDARRNEPEGGVS